MSYQGVLKSQYNISNEGVFELEKKSHEEVFIYVLSRYTQRTHSVHTAYTQRAQSVHTAYTQHIHTAYTEGTHSDGTFG